MKNNKSLAINCDQLDRAVQDGTAKKKMAVDVGLEHQHWIYVYKFVSGTNPSKYLSLNSSSGSHFFKIRPNEIEGPSSEGGQSWDWYVLSCPHEPPCPFM
jgi:hypothetical protein